MKYIDAFLAKLKTDRNTFITYILVLISTYIVIDRLIEIIFIAATGMSLSYWGPIQYTLAIACVTFALWFSFSSKFVKYEEQKLTYLYIFAIAFYIVVVSLAIQWINKLEWILFFSVPNYSYIIANFYEYIRPAFSAIAWYIPIVTFYPVLFKGLYMKINDSQVFKDSIFDCRGINLTTNNDGYGPYTCEMYYIKDEITGQTIKTAENKRYESTIVVGPSGAGKTTMIFEPMIARDLEKKYFYKEASKELGYNALKTGLATLKKPYSNDYLNENFNLNMLVPNKNKEKLFKSYLSKMVLFDNGDTPTYRNLGLTYIAPDEESLNHMTEVADNFNLKYEVLDPGEDAHSTIGLNPFVYQEPRKAAVAVSAILREMYEADFDMQSPALKSDTTLGSQAVENLVILLKLIFPKINSGMIPTLEDLFNCINDFTLVQKMTTVLEADETLSKEYEITINYLKNTFYEGGTNYNSIKEELKIPASQIELLLRYDGIKNILCNRTDNLDYDKVLSEGEIVFICTRRGELGATLQRSFGLFCILLMQQSVLSRPGIEKSRTPYFLYIDEFPPYITSTTKDIFTLYRKYRVGTIISAQNLSQLGNNGDSEKTSYRQTILSNCATEIVFGGGTMDDYNWWEKEFGSKRQWNMGNTYHTNGAKNADGKPGYDEALGGIKYDFTANYKAGKFQATGFKTVFVNTKNSRNSPVVGRGKVDFLDEKYKKPAKIKTYNFNKFIPKESKKDEEEKEDKEEKFDLRKVDFQALAGSAGQNDIDPIAKNNAKNSFKGTADVDPIKEGTTKKRNKKKSNS